MKNLNLSKTRHKKLQMISTYSKGILIDKDILDDIGFSKHFSVNYDPNKRTIVIKPLYDNVADLDN